VVVPIGGVVVVTVTVAVVVPVMVIVVVVAVSAADVLVDAEQDEQCPGERFQIRSLGELREGADPEVRHDERDAADEVSDAENQSGDRPAEPLAVETQSVGRGDGPAVVRKNTVNDTQSDDAGDEPQLHIRASETGQ